MSSDPAELKKLVKQLQSASNNTDILGILSILKRDFQINEAILRESKAGLAVGKLRNSSTKEVADAAKDLVKKWKAEVDKAKASSGSTSKPQGSASKSSTNGPATPVTPTASTAKTETRTAKSDGVTINFTGDKTRDKCTELIYDALVSDSGAPSELVSKKARDVELAVFNSHGGATAEYRARIRSLFVNLKDKNNPGLRESVVSGLIAADKLAKMSSD
ncbi:transcription elongation factor s-ii, partial [Moniliophthora roreri MCA 2997]